MSERPELPPARRRRTAVTICTYLGVQPTEKRVNLLADVLLTGELDFAIACYRNSDITEKRSGFVGWRDSLIAGLKEKLDSLAYLQEAFWINPKDSDKSLAEIQDGDKPAAPLVRAE